MKLIGVDIGGTFTDVVFTDTEQHLTCIHKVPPTPEDPAIGVLEGITVLCTTHGIPREHGALSQRRHFRCRRHLSGYRYHPRWHLW